MKKYSIRVTTIIIVVIISIIISIIIGIFYLRPLPNSCATIILKNQKVNVDYYYLDEKLLYYRLAKTGEHLSTLPSNIVNIVHKKACSSSLSLK